MSILADKETRLIVQGITGNEGLFHTRAMVAYGTNVVAGMTPGKSTKKSRFSIRLSWLLTHPGRIQA
jgi:succinyl-CoA synthetase alpha subunit